MPTIKFKVTSVAFEFRDTDDWEDSYRKDHNLDDDAEIDQDNLVAWLQELLKDGVEEGTLTMADLSSNPDVTVEVV